MDDAANAALRVAAAAAAWGVQQEAMMAADEGNCDFWQRGTCRYGPSCWFSHDEQAHQQHPLPPTPAPMHSPSPFTKPLARIIPLALTPNRYMHPQQIQPSRYTAYTSLAAPTQTTSAQATVSAAGGGNGNGGGGGGGPVSTRSVCRYWLQGICNRGPACRFLHGAAAPAAGDGRHHPHHHHHHHHHHNTSSSRHHRTAHIQQQIQQQYHHAQQQGLSTVLAVVRPSAPRPRPRSFDIRYLPTAAYASMQPTAAGAQIDHVATAGVVLQQPTTGRLRAYTYPPARSPAPVMDADDCDDQDVNCVDGDDCGSVDDYGLPFDLDEWDDFAGGAAKGEDRSGIVDGILHGAGTAGGSALPRLRDLRSIWDDGGVGKAEFKNVVASPVIAQPVHKKNVGDGVWKGGLSSSANAATTAVGGTLQMFEKLAL
ncbi:hypothetical protein HDU89_002524 [Geranomyces variabilis]|nr:hypothetical protein HDU89_002524 [Geranomyces variabilis]